ncbi:MAG: RlmE family RNA methyltransferase [Deltaproteobacteria bacterium]|nr:MAG: RlmE family RNA methyltransferase [Deltaproteobacteria bacterium]
MPRATPKKAKWADHYTRLARKDRYPARSVYKLKEIQAKYRLIRPGSKVLDLGCAPGAWLLYAAEKTGPGGCVVGIDIKPVTISLPGQVRVVTADLFTLAPDFWQSAGAPFDSVISDLAPATTGNKMVDTARSSALCETALAIAVDHLVIGGSFVCKVFQGPDFQPFVANIKRLFKRYDIFKPQSSRKASREIYITGLTFSGGNHVRT